MPNIEFITADARVHRSELIELNVEYLSWVFTEVEKLFHVSVEQIVGLPAHAYVPTIIDKVCGDPPPKGIFYLIQVDNQLAGMGGLRCLRDGVCEIKRIYIRPTFRGMKLGELALRRILADAVAFGYQRACLDTGLFMQSAHRLYESHGFVDCAPYEGVETPPQFHARWRFMERAL